MGFVIAIDGPAAAGKGTLSRRIAETYGFQQLDTGLTYRATAKALLDAGLPLDDEDVAEKMARAVDLGGLDRSVLSRHEIGEAASRLAVILECGASGAGAPKRASLAGRQLAPSIPQYRLLRPLRGTAWTAMAGRRAAEDAQPKPGERGSV